MVTFPHTLLGAAPGYTLLRMVIRKSGQVDECRLFVVQETSRLWTHAVLNVLAAYRYEPARRQGHKVSSWIEQRFDYRTVPPASGTPRPN
jgi:hypothetical protein